MAAIIRGIVRNFIEWTLYPFFDTLILREVNGVQMPRVDLSKF